MKKGFLFSLALLAAATVQAFPAIPKESAKALGATKGKPFTEGLVFVNGKFIPPPYVVERWGTGIRINKIPVTGPVIAWSEFLKTQKDVVVETTEAPPAEASETPAESRPSEAPESSSDATETPSSSDDAASLDDLFGAAEPAEATVVFVERALASSEGTGTVTDADGHEVMKLDGPAPRETEEDKGDAEDGDLDALFESDASEPQATPEPEPASGPSKPKAKPRKTPAKPKTRLVLKGAFVKNTASQMLVSKINAQRAEIDRTLRSGGFLCFGDKYARISGDRAAMSRLISALPEIQMKSETFEAFCAAVRAANLFYLHEPVCDDLFVHRIDYRALQEYRAKLRKDREWKKMMEGAQPLF